MSAVRSNFRAWHKIRPSPEDPGHRLAFAPSRGDSPIDPVCPSEPELLGMKSPFGADVPSHPLHKSQDDLEFLTSSLDLTTEKAHLNELFGRVTTAIILVDADEKSPTDQSCFYKGFRRQRRRSGGPIAGCSNCAGRSFEKIETHASRRLPTRSGHPGRFVDKRLN